MVHDRVLVIIITGILTTIGTSEIVFGERVYEVYLPNVNDITFIRDKKERMPPYGGQYLVGCDLSLHPDRER